MPGVRLLIESKSQRGNMRSIIITRLVPLLLFFPLGTLTLAYAQKKVEQRQETPNERFYRKGGKTTKAKVISKDRELTTADITQGRDLSLYDDGRHFNCYLIYEGDEPECNIPKIRKFIWQHWQNKQRGYIRITFGSIDAVSTSHIFIEPDEQGMWHVAWRIVRHSGEIDDIPDIRSLKQRLATKSDFTHDQTKIILSFIDWEGDEIQTL
jgi:hypothetical protein